MKSKTQSTAATGGPSLRFSQAQLVKKTFIIVLGALLFFASSSVQAQSVLSGGFPGNWGAASTPPALPTVYPAGKTGDVSGDAVQSFYSGESGLIQLQSKGTVTDHPFVGPSDAFRYNIILEQSFTLTEAAIVVIPTYLKGKLSVGAGFGPTGAGVDGHVNIYNPAGVSQLSLTLSDSYYGTPFTQTTDKFGYASVSLAAGTYKVRADLEINGDGGSVAAGEGDNATANFYNDAANEFADGLATSLAAYPAGLANSRAAINAVTARSTYGLDGTGVKVGLVELGNPYTTHTSLPAGRLIIANAAADTADYSREHALATAGIIAGADTNTANAGVAPGAKIYSAAAASHGTLLDSLKEVINNQGVHVVNMSAGNEAITGDVNLLINQHANVTMVMSAGNSEPSGSNSVVPPGMSMNIITVGALTRDFTKRADFSSYSHLSRPIKPDIVAPGEYINAPVARDIDFSGGAINDFNRIFVGDDLDHYVKTVGGTARANTGDISGTSFAAPHVAGAAALMVEYQLNHTADHDRDHRVIKAVLLNTANRTVKHLGGAAWAQDTTGSLAANTYKVRRSLDEEVGAGEVDVLAAMGNYAPAEIRGPDTNGNANFNIDATGVPKFWDLERATAGDGKVNYLLGEAGNAHLFATLTWDFDADDTDDNGFTGFQQLELKLYHEGTDDNNPVGWDLSDTLIAETVNTLGDENVKLFDFIIPDFGPTENPGYYLQVINTGASAAMTYGLAVMVPEPATILLAAIGALGLLVQRRKFGIPF